MSRSTGSCERPESRVKRSASVRPKVRACQSTKLTSGRCEQATHFGDPVLPEDQLPNVIGRARFGAIAIANSDAGAAAYTDSAIDQAHRAVAELLAM